MASHSYALSAGAFTPLDELHLDGIDVHALKKLPRFEKEVWQCVVRKMRCWSAEHAEADSLLMQPDLRGPEPPERPCRPYCMFLLESFPVGRLIGFRAATPVNVYPSPAEVLRFVTALMLAPHDDALTPRRPRSIVFSDINIAASLFHSFKELGVECSQLFEPESMLPLVKAHSKATIRQGVGIDSAAMYDFPGALVIVCLYCT